MTPTLAEIIAGLARGDYTQEQSIGWIEQLLSDQYQEGYSAAAETYSYEDDR